jgi:hypothetical protein
LDLKEVSVVTFAANDRARVDDVKHSVAAGVMPTVREFEEILRDAGFSKSKATAILAAACKPHLRGEPEAKANEELIEFLEALCAPNLPLCLERASQCEICFSAPAMALPTAARLGAMTASERSAGRYMRAPDHDDVADSGEPV